MAVNNVYIFDVDDTLIDTKACIRAIDEHGRVVFKAGTKVFNAPDSTERLLRPGLAWDFTEFESFDQLMSEPLRKPFEILKSLNPEQNRICIATARQCYNELRRWLEVHGVDVNHIQIYCYNRYVPTVAEWKGSLLADIICTTKSQDPIRVHIYEDDLNNRVAMSRTCEKYGIEHIIHAI